MSTLNSLERSVLDMLLDGAHPVLISLRQQLESVSVTKRVQTGAGFYCYLNVPDDAPRMLGMRDLSFGDVHAELKGLRFGAGFVLFVRQGALHMLEGYSYQEDWPVSTDRFELRYLNAPRDLTMLA